VYCGCSWEISFATDQTAIVIVMPVRAEAEPIKPIKPVCSWFDIPQITTAVVTGGIIFPKCGGIIFPT
jgi:hypothetical protein